MSHQQNSPTCRIATAHLPANPTQLQIDAFCKQTGMQVETVQPGFQKISYVASVPNPSAKRANSSPVEETKENTKRNMPLKSGESASSAIDTTLQGTIPGKPKQPPLTINELWNLVEAKIDSTYDILKKEINILRNLFKQTKEDVQKLEIKTEKQNDDMELLYRQANDKTLIIFNLPEEQHENSNHTTQQVHKLLENLKTTAIQIDQAYRLGRPKEGTVRPIALKLLRIKDKNTIMKEKFQLQQNALTKSIGISPSYSKDERKRINLLLTHAHQERTNNPYTKFKVRNSVLYIDQGGTTSQWKLNAKNEIIEHKL